MRAVVICLCVLVLATASYAEKLPYGTPLGVYNGIVNFSNNGGSRTYDFLGWEYECVEYVNRYFHEIYDYPSWKGKIGDAWKYFSTVPRITNDTVAYENAKTSVPPQPGDILVWGRGPSLSKGHVAIVRDVGPSSVTVIQQNVTQDSGDSFYTLPLYVDGRNVSVTSDLGPILGWLRTSREPNKISIVDDDNVTNTFTGSYYDGTETESVVNGKGYLNGYKYLMSTALDGFYYLWWDLKPPVETTYDVMVFIPQTHLSASRAVPYKVEVFGCDGSYRVSEVKTVFDQSITSAKGKADRWFTLFQGIHVPQNTCIRLITTHSTGENSKAIIYDAVKFVAYPW